MWSDVTDDQAMTGVKYFDVVSAVLFVVKEH